MIKLTRQREPILYMNNNVQNEKKEQQKGYAYKKGRKVKTNGNKRTYLEKNKQARIKDQNSSQSEEEV